MKETLKFFTIFITVLLIYFAIILHIDYFTISYDNTIQKRENPYFMYQRPTSIFYELELSEGNTQLITDKNIEVIKNSKIIKSLLKEACNIEEEQINTYIEKLKKDKKISKINNLMQGEVLYIDEENYKLAFTLDSNNIAYQIKPTYSKNTLYSYKEITEETKQHIYKKSKEDMERLGILQKFKFEPETMYIQYFNGEIANWNNDRYIVEDLKNHIKLEYELQNYTIQTLQIGFEYATGA